MSILIGKRSEEETFVKTHFFDKTVYASLKILLGIIIERSYVKADIIVVRLTKDN